MKKGEMRVANGEDGGTAMDSKPKGTSVEMSSRKTTGRGGMKGSAHQVFGESLLVFIHSVNETLP
jgi:hypothetical protein